MGGGRGQLGELARHHSVPLMRELVTQLLLLQMRGRRLLMLLLLLWHLLVLLQLLLLLLLQLWRGLLLAWGRGW